MAMQSGGATKHGVIQSSIALLQERFRQLQKEKEMRERRQLLRSNTFVPPSSPSPSCSSDSEPEKYNNNNNNNDHFKLLFADEVAVVRRPEFYHPPSHHHQQHAISLSLWPGGSSESYNATVDGGGRGEKATAGLKGAKEEDYYKLCSSRYGFLGLDVKCDDSRVSDVDTSLHL